MLLIAAVFMASTQSKATISYSLSFPRASEHYVHVIMRIPLSPGQTHLDFVIPVWTPGSYKVREFSQHVEQVRAKGLSHLKVERPEKAVWRILNDGADTIVLEYDVYCFAVSVRQSYVDMNYAFLHGVSVFGYIEGRKQEQIRLSLSPAGIYKDVHVPLHRESEETFTFTCSDYDLLVDSPIALGEFDVIEYISGDVPHRVVMIGEGNYKPEQIQQDFKKICDEQVKMFGSHPIKEEGFAKTPVYIHFIQNVNAGGGGLEHANCQTSQIQRWAYENKEKYKNFLGLVAHEYFHLWNVKRIRPLELGPFNYKEEVYTDLLWLAEGITSYYDDLVLYRSGLHSMEEYLNVIATQINRYENTIGKGIMDLGQSSRLAWIKAYLPNENSSNTSISYYNKGMIAAMLLDLEIIQASKGKSSLDAVMRKLYVQYLEGFRSGTDRGITEREFIQLCSQEAGKDLTDFLNKLIHSTSDIDYARSFSAYAIAIKDEYADRTQAWSGISSKLSDGKVVITGIASGSPATHAGLSVNDELISNNNWRLDQTMEEDEKHFEVGDSVEIIYNRDGKLATTVLIFGRNPEHKYQLVASKEENKLREIWLQRDQD